MILPRDPLWRLRMLCGVPAAWACLILVQLLTGLPFQSVRTVPASAFKSWEENTWSIRDRFIQEKLPGSAISFVRLLENGHPPGPEQTSRSNLRHQPGAAWAVTGSGIHFRTGDGSDPRSNGRRYQVVLPWRVPTGLVLMTMPALLASLTLLLRLRTGFWPLALACRLWNDALNVPAGQPASHGAKLRLASQAVLLALIIAFFTTPLILTVWRYHSPERFDSHPWLANLTLPRPPVLPDIPPLSAISLADASWQSAAATTFNNNFTGREGLIRYLSEAWWLAFRAPAAPESEVVIQPGNQLIETRYLTEYCLVRPAASQFLPFVRDLRRFQDRCDQQHLPLAFILTPSKAAFQPSGIPPAWQARIRPGPRAIDLLIPLLQEHGVRFIDGISLTKEREINAPAPVFPQGGIHWNADAAWQSTAAVLKQFRQSLPNLPVPTPPVISTSLRPVGEDRDLETLLTLVRPWSGLVAELTFPEIATPEFPFEFTFSLGPPRPRLAAVGGSFTGRIIQQLGSSGIFRDLTLFFYYRICRQTWQPGQPLDGPPPQFPDDLTRTILGSSAILLEANEASLEETGPRHLREFLSDALALPPPAP